MHIKKKNIVQIWIWNSAKNTDIFYVEEFFIKEMSGKRHSSVHIKHIYLIYFVENPAMLIWLEKLTQFFSKWRMWLENLKSASWFAYFFIREK